VRDREEWHALIAQAKAEFAREQHDGPKQNEKFEFTPTGSMLMLGSSCTGDYNQMSRRVQDGISVKKIRRAGNDTPTPAYLLPYRDEQLPKSYRVRDEDDGMDGSRRQNVVSPRQRERSPASDRGTRPPTGSRQVPEIPQIASMSFTGGMGMDDTSSYAAMCRRRPEKGLPGKPISLYQLGVFDTLPEQERLMLLSSTDDKVLVPSPRSSNEASRPRTSAVTSRREQEYDLAGERRANNAESADLHDARTRPWTASVCCRMCTCRACIETPDMRLWGAGRHPTNRRLAHRLLARTISSEAE